MPPYTTHPPLSNLNLTFLRSSLHPSGDAPALRLDGRLPLSYRPVGWQFLGAVNHSGAVEVAIGETRAIATVTAEISSPHSDRPNEGLLSVDIDLSPVAALPFDGSRRIAAAGATDAQTVYQIELERTISRVLRDSRAVDTESLVIIGGKYVWAIRLNVAVINADGNLMDAAVVASLTALLHFRRADVTVVGDAITIHSIDERQPVPLSISHLPVSTTFALIPYAAPAGGGLQSAAEALIASSVAASQPLDKDYQLIIDPSAKEEAAAAGTLTTIANNHGQLLYIHQVGGNGLTSSQLQDAVTLSVERSKSLAKEMQQEASSDIDKRLKQRARASIVQNPITV